MAITTVLHDAFARYELMRESLSSRRNEQSCEWCGRPAKFRYWAEQDDKGGGRDRERQRRAAKPFCSVGCYRTYYQ